VASNLQRTALVLLFLLPVATHARGENWPQWRGPAFNGSSPETNLPVSWSKVQGVAWITPLPGKSGATPIVWDNSIFLPSPSEDQSLRLFCLDKASGRVRWQKVAANGNREAGKNNRAASSAVTEGKRVYILFGTGDFVAFDFDGKELWHDHLWDTFGTFELQFFYGGSPLLFEGKLYLQLLQQNPPTYAHAKDSKPDRRSWLLCFDPESGKILWQQERKTQAPGEAMEAYTTPVPFFGPNGVELILAGADCVTAHRLDSGQEIWRFAGLNLKRDRGGRIVPSPVATPDFIFACGPRRQVLVALRTDGIGLVDDSQVAWRIADLVPDVCTPLYYQGKLFVLDGDRQTMTCFKPATGEKLWQGRLGVREIFNSSPTGADGKIYCLGEDGTVVILSAGNNFEVLATIPMGESPCSSSVVAAGGCLFIRTAKNLYCIKGKAQ
jgi:outer membrane protein assembly factor BamB